MKNLALKSLVIAFLLLSNFTSFAQEGPGGPTDCPTCPEPPDPGTPIDTKLFLLAIAGIAFAFYYFSSKRKANS